MDSTPIYTELQKTLIDPEADHWNTSGPPEFVASLDSHAEQAHASGSHSAGSRKKQSGRSSGRRHRAED